MRCQDHHGSSILGNAGKSKIGGKPLGRPLLTDEIIERANRGEVISDPPLVDDEETKIIRTDQGRFGYATPQGEFNQDTMQIEVDREVVKSRRIENQKRGVFQAKLNKILLWIILLLVVLLAAIIWL